MIGVVQNFETIIISSMHSSLKKYVDFLPQKNKKQQYFLK